MEKKNIEAESILNKKVYDVISSETNSNFTKGLIKIIQTNSILYSVEKHQWLMIAQLYSWFCMETELTKEEFYAGIIYPLIVSGKVELFQVVNEFYKHGGLDSCAIKYLDTAEKEIIL